MRRIVIAFSMMCGACASADPQAASTTPAPMAAAKAVEADNAKPAKTKRVCDRVEEDPSSRMGGKVVCREVKVTSPSGT